MGTKTFYYCHRIESKLWKVSWVEHSSLKQKFFFSETDPTFLDFAQIRALKGITLHEARVFMGIAPPEPKKKV